MIYDLNGTSSEVFPDITHMDIEPDGIIAIGGDLSPQRILAAYSQGVFPMPYIDEEGKSLLEWWTFPERLIIYPHQVKFSKSWLQRIRKHDYEVKMDTNFAGVISACKNVSRQGGWITHDIVEAFVRMHQLGYAHSVEVYTHNELVGGLYGMCLGNMFVGDSMFHTQSDMSKIAFYHLVQLVKVLHMDFIDCQQVSPHFLQWGGTIISREDFYPILRHSLSLPTLTGDWTGVMDKVANDIKINGI